MNRSVVPLAGHGLRPPVLRRRASRPQLKRDPFYESDCQGETSSPLMAWRSSPEQSAPSAERTRPAGASGSAWQSSSASVSSLELPIHTGRSQALGSHARARATVLSETRYPAGLTLVRVLRGGLELAKYLGVTAGRANESLETAPRTRVPDPGAVGEGHASHRRLAGPV